MKRILFATTLVAVVALAYFAGRHAAPPGHGPGAGGRRVLYWVDPMHPSYRSDRPGTAPDCGMPLEPVYEGEDPAGMLQLPTGAVAIAPDRQRLVGVRVEAVARSTGRRHVRTTARVQADPDRVHVITAGAGGWVKSLANSAEGVLVHEDDVLMTYYSREFRAAQQSYISSVTGLDPRRAQDLDPTDSLRPSNSSPKLAEEQLLALGMSEAQLRELARTKRTTTDIVVTSPIDGIVVARNVTPEQRFDRGVELYRIVDLSRVWIVADLYGDDAEELRPGMHVKVTAREVEQRDPRHGERAHRPTSIPRRARSSCGSRRTTRGWRCAPTCSSTSSSTSEAPEGISVHGRRDPRQRHAPDRVRGVEPGRVRAPHGRDRRDVRRPRRRSARGLVAGDRVVTAGTFMIDSESRMRSAAPAAGIGARRGPRHVPRGRAAGRTIPSAAWRWIPALAVATGARSASAVATYVFCSALLPAEVRLRPDRSRSGAPAGRQGRRREAMISRIIEFSVRNKFLVLMLVAAALPLGRLVHDAPAARRYAGPERNAGHHPLPLGPQSGHDRRPGHLSHHHRDDRRAAGEDGARHLGFRVLVRLRGVRRGHGYLLGALADARVPLVRDCRGCRRA